MTKREIVFTESDCGTHLDGTHGWHNTARVVRKAMGYGFKIDAKELAALETYENESGEDDNEIVSGQGGLSDRATEYLGEITAPGLEWVWDMGELSLMTETDADEFGHHG